jgi:predicted ribosome quality control (RQC) complex YloA/Tae2 family protein
MKVTLDIRKSVDENATSYFEAAKKDRKKVEGARKVIEEYKVKQSESDTSEEKKIQRVSRRRKAEWFEKFRWFTSSDGFLVIGGRDASTNEIVIKKHAEENDLVFHTDMAGSPFVVVKRDGKESIPDSTLEEAADFTAVFSRGWKAGMATLPVFCARPSQVSKTPNPGESLPKGAFVIRGELRYFTPRMQYAVGLFEDKIMGGPVMAVEKQCEKHVRIMQGDDKVSDVAKALQKRLGGELDEIIRVLPQGCKISKN